MVLKRDRFNLPGSPMIFINDKEEYNLVFIMSIFDVIIFFTVHSDKE
jgi:hypothetical protein